METRIWLRGRYIVIEPGDYVCTTRAVTSFAHHNGLRDCLFKSQGGYYKLEMNGMLTFVERCLYMITFEQLYNVLKD